jgi:FkbM family methyltransferase
MHLESHNTIYSHVLYINPDDEIGREIIRKGIYDRSCIEILKSILKQISSAVVFDIGANIGNHAISISAECKEIHAFEPDADIISILRKNINANHINNIIANETGLSDSDCYSDFYVNMDGNIGASTLDSNTKGRNFKKTRVHLTTGDNYINENSVAYIDLMKIDVEGHEIQVLDGFHEAIPKLRPIILMEWSAVKTINESINSNIFQCIKQNYTAFIAASSRNKSLWSNGFSGKVKRLLHKLFYKEKWYLVPADLTRPQANFFCTKWQVDTGYALAIPRQVADAVLFA